MSNFSLITHVRINDTTLLVELDMHDEDPRHLFKVVDLKNPSSGLSVRAWDIPDAKKKFIQLFESRRVKENLKSITDMITEMKDVLRRFIDISKEEISINIRRIEDYIHNNRHHSGSLYHIDLVLKLASVAMHKSLDTDTIRNATVICGRLLDIVVTELFEHKGIDWLKGKLLNLYGDFALITHIETIVDNHNNKAQRGVFA